MKTGDFRDMDPWRIFRIMAEFVDGFEEMATVSPAISIFGSARTQEGHPYYELTRKVAARLSSEGIHIITGGGPGIMEAANRGAKEGGHGISIGLNIDLPFEQESNPYIEKLLDFRYFFVRKVMFSKYSRGLVCMPGGFGTLDELFENLTLVQTKKIPAIPIVLMGSEYWSGMIDWLRNVMLKEMNISDGDIELMLLTDDVDEAVAHVKSALIKDTGW